MMNLVITIVDERKCVRAGLWLSYKLEPTLLSWVSETEHVNYITKQLRFIQGYKFSKTQCSQLEIFLLDPGINR